MTEEKTRYRFICGNLESTGTITKRQNDLIHAILDNQLVEYLDNFKAGGNAFPRRSNGDGGMSLRDYFAGQALTHMKDTYADQMASRAYQIADEMLKERVK